MELLIMAMVGVFLVKNAAVDTTAMVTGKTPPSHAYRMAKMRAEGRKVDPDPDRRAGASRVLRHWYLDACEDVDHWRAHRRRTRPERKAAGRARRERRSRFVRGWAKRGPDQSPEPEDIVDAEVVDDTPQPEQQAPPQSGPRPQPEPRPESAAPPPSDSQPGPADPPRRTHRRRTTTTTTTDDEIRIEEIHVSDETGLVVYGDRPEAERPPLPHRRMVLAMMIAEAGHVPDWQVIGRMSGEEVDQALEILMQRRRAQAAPSTA